MKTDDLVALLAKDAATVPKGRAPARLMIAAGLGALLAFGALVVWLGIRPDLAAALRTGAFWMKALYTFGLAAGGFLVVERLSRPGARGRLGAGVIALCVAGIGIAAIVQLALAAPDGWPAALLGSSWNRCPWRILVLALPGLLVVLLGVRQLAPTRLALAGAMAGLLAGAVSATVYGLYCEETAAPFVAIWYTLGMLLSAALGAILGRRMLAW